MECSICHKTFKQKKGLTYHLDTGGCQKVIVKRLEDERIRVLAGERAIQIEETKRREELRIKQLEEQHAVEEQRKHALEEQQKQLEEQRKRQLEEEQQKQLEEQRKHALEEQRKRQLEEEQQKQLEEEQQKQLEEQRKRQLEEEQQKQLEEQRKRLLKEQHEKQLEEQRKRLLKEQHEKQLENERIRLREEHTKKIEDERLLACLNIESDIELIKHNDTYINALIEYKKEEELDNSDRLIAENARQVMKELCKKELENALTKKIDKKNERMKVEKQLVNVVHKKQQKAEVYATENKKWLCDMTRKRGYYDDPNLSDFQNSIRFLEHISK
jgi:male-specific lethal 1